MRSRWALALTAAVSIVFGGAVAASATAPVSLGSTRVVDEAGVLSAADERAVQDRSEQLTEASDLDLWVVFVDEFTDPADAADWANTVARDNNLGIRQYVLAVAVEGRAYYLSGDSEGPVSDDALAAIERDRIQPELSDGDWAGAAIAAADGLAAATGGGGGVGFGGVLFIGLLVVVVGGVIWLVIRSRRKGTSGTATRRGPAELPLEELERQAGSALVQTDDAIKTSEQELGFARAQFGDEATAPFAETLAQAKADLDKAFSLKQQLDDSVPDSEEDARAWNTQIIELCAHANSELDAKAAAFDELRQLEQNAPEALTRAQGDRVAANPTVEAAAARLTELQAAYAPDELATVADNISQARQRLAFADEQLAQAEAAIGAGDGARAAVGIRAAEEATTQATLLCEAVARLGDDLTGAERDAAALVAELQKDLATAEALPQADGRIAGVIAGTRQQLATAQPLLAGTAKRPMQALDTLEKANSEIDGVLAGIRDEEEKKQRAAQQLQQLLTHAQAQVSAAEDYITSRRGAVGATARTRLAEAGASIVQARQLAQTDPVQAVSVAQRANDLAAQAIRLAQNDVGSFSGGGGGGGDLMGAVLGGIVINSMLGGGRSRGGGMPSMRSPGRGGGFGGGRSSGSFGGGGTRSRRGGGRF